MKILTIVLLMMATLAAPVVAQNDSKSYRMYDVVYIKPKYDKLEELGLVMAKHNRDFHSTAPYRASIWSVSGGDHTGWWAWVMGPLTFTDLDTRPGDKAHNDDWQREVMPLIDDIDEANFWRYDSTVSYDANEPFSGSEIWTTYYLEPYQGYRFTAMLTKVKQVYQQKSLPNSFEVYRASFDTKDGGNVLIAFPFKNYAWFDEDRDFGALYDDVHGKGAWEKFRYEYRDVVKYAQDELTTFIPELSGGTEENQ
jgi:hypothetical protein